MYTNWNVLAQVLRNTPDTGGAPAVTPPAPAPALPAAPAGELSPETISEFVTAAEMGGWVDGPGAGNEDFPDLPPTPEATPAAPPAPSAPVEPVVESVPPAPSSIPGATPPVPPVPLATPAAANQGGQPPVPPAAPVAAPQVAPASQAAPTAVAPPAPAPATAPASQVDPFAQMSQNLQAAAGQFIDALAKQEYAITPEDHEAFMSGDTNRLSTLCAKIQYNSVNSVLASISKLMPVMVDGLLTVQKQQDERESAFWDANPHLRRAEHRDLVKTVMRTYNQLNPQASDADRFKAVGLLTAQMYNIPLAQQAAPVAPVPQAPPVRTPGPVVRTVSPPGFAPASASPAPPQASPPPAGAWDGFVNFAEMSERGVFDPQG